MGRAWGLENASVVIDGGWGLRIGEEEMVVSLQVGCGSGFFTEFFFSFFFIRLSPCFNSFSLWDFFIDFLKIFLHDSQR